MSAMITIETVELSGTFQIEIPGDHLWADISEDEWDALSDRSKVMEAVKIAIEHGMTIASIDPGAEVDLSAYSSD